jgi:hypothetical protein
MKPIKKITLMLSMLLPLGAQAMESKPAFQMKNGKIKLAPTLAGLELLFNAATTRKANGQLFASAEQFQQKMQEFLKPIIQKDTQTLLETLADMPQETVKEIYDFFEKMIKNHCLNILHLTRKLVQWDNLDQTIFDFEGTEKEGFSILLSLSQNVGELYTFSNKFSPNLRNEILKAESSIYQNNLAFEASTLPERITPARQALLALADPDTSLEEIQQINTSLAELLLKNTMEQAQKKMKKSGQVPSSISECYKLLFKKIEEDLPEIEKTFNKLEVKKVRPAKKEELNR